MISRAEKIDATALTELTLRSKSHWKYGKEQIQAWIKDLTITENYILENQVFKLVDKSLLVGFYAYAPVSKKEIKLTYLFVDPEFIGKGYGKLLLEDFMGRMETSGFRRVVIDADPHAEKFYIRQGFRAIGKQESSIKNRFLPIMAKDIKQIIEKDCM